MYDVIQDPCDTWHESTDQILALWLLDASAITTRHWTWRRVIVCAGWHSREASRGAAESEGKRRKPFLTELLTHPHTQTRCFPHPRAICKSILAPGKRKWMLARSVERRRGLWMMVALIYSSWRWWLGKRDVLLFVLGYTDYECIIDGWSFLW